MQLNTGGLFWDIGLFWNTSRNTVGLDLSLEGGAGNAQGLGRSGMISAKLDESLLDVAFL